MGGFKDYLAGLKKTPMTPDRLKGYIGDEAPKEGEVRNPLYHRSALKVWGPNDHHYLPPIRPDYHERMKKVDRGEMSHDEVDAHRWREHPLEELDTSTLISPQKHLDLAHLKTFTPAHLTKPITVTRTASGQHIIQDGNHRAVFAHATTGKIMAHVFTSKRK